MAGKPRTEPTPQALSHAEKAEAIIALVDAGASVREAISRVSNTITFDGFRKWLKRQPEINARMKAAQQNRGHTAAQRNRVRPPPKPSAARLTCAAHFEEIVALAESGMSFPEACAARQEYPPYHYFMKYAKQDEARHARVMAISRRWHEANQYSEDDYDRALRQIGSDLSSHVEHVRVPGAPSYIRMYERAQKDSDFKRRFDAAISRRRMASLTREQGGARAQLHSHPLFRNAFALLRMRDNQDREDLISDAIVAMLESREVKRGDLIKEHYQRISDMRTTSVNQMVGYGRTTVLDTIRTDNIAWGA